MTNSATTSAAFLLRVRFDCDAPRLSQLTKSEWASWGASLVERGLVGLAENEFFLTSAGEALVDEMVVAASRVF